MSSTAYTAGGRRCPVFENEEEETLYPPKRTDHGGRRAYSIVLTREEYRSADYMSARGYLGEITERASDTEWSEDEETVTLRFTEPAAWDVRDVCESDEPAVWALTTPSTSLGEKFIVFLDSIV
jgi:hypothetical protein